MRKVEVLSASVRMSGSPSLGDSNPLVVYIDQPGAIAEGLYTPLALVNADVPGDWTVTVLTPCRTLKRAMRIAELFVAMEPDVPESAAVYHDGLLWTTEQAEPVLCTIGTHATDDAPNAYRIPVGGPRAF